MWKAHKPPGWMLAASIISIGGLLNGYGSDTYLIDFAKEEADDSLATTQVPLAL